MVSSPYVIKSGLVRDHIKRRFPAAVALEMEGFPLALTATTEFAEWIVVKGIVDWADQHKTDTHHTEAATNAALVVLHVLTHT